MASTKQRVSDTYIQYMKNLGLSLEDLQGKTILDIGADTGIFAKELEQKLGGDVTIISIDRLPAKDNYKVKKMSTKRLAFKNSTFDLVISHAAFPNMLEQTLLSDMLQVMRVLKSDGKVVLAPVIWNRKYNPKFKTDYRSEIFKYTLESLKWMRFQISYTELDESSVRIEIQNPAPR